MQISSRFTIAIHMLSYMALYEDKQKVTSDVLSASITANPVVIRRLLSQLKKAGLIHVARGSGGASLAKPPAGITFLDVYRAVEAVSEDGLFHFHEHPNVKCPVGRTIHAALDEKLARVERAMEKEMQSITLEDVVIDMKKNV